MSQIIRNRFMFVVSYYKNVFPEVQKFILLRYGDNSLSLMAKVIIYILYLHIDRLMQKYYSFPIIYWMIINFRSVSINLYFVLWQKNTIILERTFNTTMVFFCCYGLSGRFLFIKVQIIFLLTMRCVYIFQMSGRIGLVARECLTVGVGY